MATRASSVSDSCAPSFSRMSRISSRARSACFELARSRTARRSSTDLADSPSSTATRDRLGESGDVDGFDAERLRGAVEGAVAGDDLDVAEAWVLVVDGDHHDGAGRVDPGG